MRLERTLTESATSGVPTPGDIPPRPPWRAEQRRITTDPETTIPEVYMGREALSLEPQKE